MICKFKRLVSVPVILIILLTNTACSALNLPLPSQTSPPDAEPTEYALSEPSDVALSKEAQEEPTESASPGISGQITLSMRTPKTLNPLLNEDTTVDNILKLLFEPLAVLDGSLKPVANTRIVENIIYSADGLSATINLREGIKWSDGSAVTAGDIKFSIDLLKNADENVIYKKNVQNISTCDIISPTSVAVSFKDASNNTPYMMMFPIIPQQYYEKEKDPSSEKNMTPVGNGVYNFSTYKLSRYVTLTSSPSAPAQRPYIYSVKVIITPDYTSDMQCFSQGLVDAVPRNYSNWGAYKGSAKANVTLYPTGYFDFIGFNFNNDAFKSVEVRRAIARLVPDDVAMKVYAGYAAASITPVNPQSWLYETDIDEYNFELEGAAEILSGRRISILVNTENDERVKLAGVLRDNLEKAGVTASVLKLPFEQYKDRLANKQYDIFVGGVLMSEAYDLSFLFKSVVDVSAADTPDGTDTIDDTLDDSLDNPPDNPPDNPEDTLSDGGAPIGENYFGYADEKMDELLEHAANAIGDEAYKKVMSDLQKYIAENLPCVGVVFRTATLLTNSRIGGEFNPSPADPYSNINEWSIGRPKS